MIAESNKVALDGSRYETMGSDRLMRVGKLSRFHETFRRPPLRISPMHRIHRATLFAGMALLPSLATAMQVADPEPAPSFAPSLAPVLPTGIALARPAAEVGQDTVGRRRAKAVTYSDGYGRRLTIHKTLSWAMLPLFAVSFASGDQILSKGADAPEWARQLHKPAAMTTAGLFGVNTVTGAWNLWEGRSDPNGRTRRIVHSVLFTAASAGFAYTGTRLADEAREEVDGRTRHRNMALGSMGLSTASWLIMLIGN